MRLKTVQKINDVRGDFMEFMLACLQNSNYYYEITKIENQNSYNITVMVPYNVEGKNFNDPDCILGDYLNKKEKEMTEFLDELYNDNDFDEEEKGNEDEG